MTVNSSVFEQEFIGTGIATEFPFTIETLDKEWIKARVDGVDVAVTVTLNQNSDGGTCLFDVAPSLDSAVLIYRDVPLSQLFDFPEYSPFPSRNVEDSIDKLTMLVAACARLVDGSYEFNGRLLIDNNKSIIFKNNEGSESPFDEGVYRFTNDDSNQWLLEQSNGNGGWVFPTPVSPKGVISKGYSDEKDQILQNQIDALQSPETSVGSLVALTGMPAGSIDLGVDDRNLIPDNSNIKDAIVYLADSNADYGISFKSVSDMTQGILPTGATAEYRISNVLHTCEFNDIIKQTWIVKASITGDDFGLELLGGLFAVLVPSSGGVTPSDFGASRNQTDNSSEIQACFDYCKLNNVQCTGVGRYYVDETVTLETGFFSSSRMLIIPLASFAAGVPVDYEDLQRRVIILNSTNITVTGLLAFNEFRVPDLVGMDYAQFQIKSYRSGAQNFAINNLVHSFSITITEGRGTGTGDPNDETTKGLVAYAPNFQSEINALNISGGEWFGNIGGAIDIGDRDEVFDTTTNCCKL